MFGFKLNNGMFRFEHLYASVRPKKMFTFCFTFWFSSDVRVTSKMMPETFWFDSESFPQMFWLMWYPKKLSQKFGSNWMIKWSKDLWAQTFPKNCLECFISNWVIYHSQNVVLNVLDSACASDARKRLKLFSIQFKHAYNDQKYCTEYSFQSESSLWCSKMMY